MAYDGELVKMENGRWARFKRFSDANSLPLLVAVELADDHQGLLNAAEDSLARYGELGIPVTVRIDPNGKGTLSLELEAAGAALH